MRPVNAALGAVATGVRLGGRVTHLPHAPVRALRSRRASGPRDFVEWMVAEFRRHDLRHLVEAGRDASGFDGRSWLRDVDAPAAVVVTTRDRAVAPQRQLEAAALIEGASVHEIDGGHFVCATERFVEPLREACRDVAARAARSKTGSLPVGAEGPVSAQTPSVLASHSASFSSSAIVCSTPRASASMSGVVS